MVHERNSKNGAVRGSKGYNAVPPGPLQQGGRYRCPYINELLVGEASTGDLNRLLGVVQVYLPHMNLVNISTALHRVAKLASSSKHGLKQVQSSDALPALVDATHLALQKAKNNSGSKPSQALSNVAWALATLRVADGALWQTAAQLAERHIASFKPFELSSILWAFAKASAQDNQVHESMSYFFSTAATYLTENRQDASFRCLVMTVWAFASYGHVDTAFFLTSGDCLADSIRTASCQELADTAWAYGTAKVLHEPLFTEIALASVRKRGTFSGRQLAEIFQALRKVGFQYQDIQETYDIVPEASQQSLSNCDVASPVSPSSLSSQTQIVVPMGWVCSVKNSFLHIESDLDERSSIDNNWSESVPEFLGGVSVDEDLRSRLDAYRLDFQRFRVGIPGSQGQLYHEV